MRLLRGIGTGILAGGIALAGTNVTHAQNGQGNGQQNSQQQQPSNTGSAPTINNNVPYTPPTMPSVDASGSGNGRSSGGFGGGQSGGSGGIGRIGANNPLADDMPQTQQQMELQQARARNAERQKQLIADTQKLVALANQLQAEVNNSTKDMLSLDVVRKADEIDKLARTVRDRMKDAN